MATLKEAETEILGELEISSDLAEEFMKQSGYFAYWAFKAARSYDQVRMLEERAELVFSHLYAEYRSKHPKDSKENDCKAYVRKHSLFKATAKKLRTAQRTADILKAAVRAFEMRRDMLIQLGAQNRAEHQSTDLSLSAKAKKATAVVRKAAKARRTRGE